MKVKVVMERSHLFERELNDTLASLEELGNVIVDIKFHVNEDKHYSHQAMIMYYTKAESRDKKIDNVLSD